MSSQLKCTVCGFDIKDDVFVGDGDGTGQRFAHQACYQRRELAEKDERIRELEQQPPCTCGSGAHPRHCKQHPQGYELHVARLNYETAQETIADMEQQLKAAQECCAQHDTVVQEIVDAKVVWATEDTPFTGPEVLELLQENERLRASGKAAQDAANYMHRSYHTIIDGECSYCEYFGPTREFRGRPR